MERKTRFVKVEDIDVECWSLLINTNLTADEIKKAIFTDEDEESLDYGMKIIKYSEENALFSEIVDFELVEI